MADIPMAHAKTLGQFLSEIRNVAPHRAKLHRTIFISDTHLGTRGCKADLLADFLAHNECKTLYLVGDIVDGWRLRQSWYWRPSHSAVMNEILKKASNGTRVIYVPGNHDEALRTYCGLTLGGVELMREALHKTADGRTLLVLHGDKFDSIVTHMRWLALLGGWAYDVAVSVNTVVNAVGRALNLPYWSLAAYLKRRVKNAGRFIARFEEAVAHEVRARGADGVVCGHIHHAEIKDIDGILYCNDGDWVESCTALTEDARGNLEIVRWTELTPQEWTVRERAHLAPAHAALGAA